MSRQIVISLLFFITFILYTQMLINLIPIRKDSVVNHIFMAICLAMSIWSLAFSISYSAQDYETALVWRRISSLGWGTLYALVVHFLLAITMTKEVMKKKWLYGLLYLPALATVYAYGLNASIAANQFKLILTDAGWVNQYSNNTIDRLFNFYYIGYMVIVLVIIIYGQRVSKVISKKIALSMFATIGITLIVSTITDVVLSAFFPGSLPQVSPVIILIPIIAVYKAIKDNSFRVEHATSYHTEEGLILDEASHTKLYSGMALTYLAGAYVLMIASYFIYRAPLKEVLLFSGVILLIGLSIELVNRKVKTDQKDVIIAIINSMTTPLVLFNFIEFSALTVWAAPIVLIMISILIRNRTVFIINSLSLVATVIFVGIEAPMQNVLIEASDHFARLSIVAMVIIIANYIHQMFLKRLKENENQVRRQKLIAHISAKFSALNKSNVHETFTESLRLFVEDFDIDRSYVYLMSDDGCKASCAYDYCSKPGLSSLREVVEADQFPWWMEEMHNRRTIKISDISTLPNEAFSGESMVSHRKIKSLLLTPIIDDGHTVGLVGFDTLESQHIWSDIAVDMAEIMAHLFAEALQKIKTNEEIEYLAYYDLLTGLPNRTLFNNRIDQEIERCKRKREKLGVLFVDLDAFKNINDTLGHENGDQVLKMVAEKLSHHVRAQDTVSRFGGDEFLILLTDIQASEDVAHIAEGIIQLFEGSLTVNHHEFFVTASIGVAMYPEDGENSVTLIKNADMAMYVSKDMGKNCYSFSSALLKENVMKKSKLTNDLYRALERHELELYYQPQIDVQTEKVIGVEALIRWHHPELGMISPLSFIPLAEQTGLIIPMGEWIIRRACQQNMAWQERGLAPIRMAVNLSVEQFRSMALVATIQNVLDQTGMDPKYLELEITESIAMDGTDHIISVLAELKALGLTVSIDDFGTEYSSLSRIKVMPIDRIKMDMNFVHSISKSAKDDAIAKIIIQLAKSLDLAIIAEGVELEHQLNFLADHGCDEVQGYYYYKPMIAGDLEKILTAEGGQESGHDVEGLGISPMGIG